MTLIRRVRKITDPWFILLLSLLFFFLRLPSLFEPYWYGDEGIYQTIGLALSKGEILYKNIWDNKPPALYYLYSILGSDQFLLRTTSLIFGVIGIIFFFLLARKLLIKPWIYRFSTLIFTILFGMPLIEGNIANAENFMIPIVIISAYLILLSSQKNAVNKNKLLIISGLILGSSFLFKIVSVFDFGAFFIFIFIYDFPQEINLKNLITQIKLKFKHLFIFTIFFTLPFIFTLIYFNFQHILKLYLSSILLSNVGYVGYGNKFIIPQGLLIFKIIILSISVFIIFWKRQYLKFNSAIFVLIWFAFSLFNSFFSQRGYPHYVIILLPSLCLLFGIIFIYNKFSKLITILFLIFNIIILSYFSFYWKNVQYYQNFTGFLLDHTSLNKYQSFFDKKTPRDYEIASFLNSNLTQEDKIFIWGNNAQVYKLTNKIPPGKYTVAYHATQYPDGLKNTKEALMRTDPKFIILMPNVSTFPFPLYNYRIRINIGGAIIYERNI